MSQLFRVVLTGNVLAGHDPATVRERIAQTFRLDAAQLDVVFSGRRVAVKRNATQAEADALTQRIMALGLSAESEAMPEVAAVPAAAPVAPIVAPVPAKPAPAPTPDASDELFSLAAPATPAPAQTAGSDTPAATLDASVETVTCPQCAEVQPKRTLCRACGIDMPRLRAARAEASRDANETRLGINNGPKTTFGPATVAAPNRYVGSEDTSMLGLGFAGRFNRSMYLASAFLSTALMWVLIGIAAFSGQMWLAVVGFVLGMIYGLRCMALRLHDMGRTGWMSLLMIVPVVNFILAVMLLFVRGDDDDNAHGPAPEGGGAKLVWFWIAMSVLASGFASKGIASNPAAVLAMASQYRLHGAHRDEQAGDDANYAADNVVVMYSIKGCDDCEKMRDWLDANGLQYTDYSVDTDSRAADALSNKIAAKGGANVRLPVMEVNGELLMDNPSTAAVRAHLREE